MQTPLDICSSPPPNTPSEPNINSSRLPNPRFPIPCFHTEYSYADFLESNSLPHPISPSKPHFSLLKHAMTRLETHGMMASPLDIGRHYGSRANPHSEDYYNLDDGFIDDSEVEIPEEITDEEWKKTLAEGSYCMSAKDFIPEIGKKRPRKRPMSSNFTFPPNLTPILSEIRAFYTKEKRGKLHSPFKSSLQKLIKEIQKGGNPQELELNVKKYLKAVTRLTTNTLNVTFI